MWRFKLPIISIIFFIIISCTKEGQELEIKPYGITFNRAMIGWESVFPDITANLFQIYLDDKLVGEVEGASYYELKGLNEATDYKGYVLSINKDGKRSGKASFSFTTIKNLPPGSFKIDINAVTGSSASFIWSRPADPDGDMITYSVVLSGDTLARGIADLCFTVTGLTPKRPYSFTVSAKDDQGNQNSISSFFETIESGAELVYRKEFFSGYLREYGIYTPSSPNPGKLPMVIHLHGYGGVVWPGMMTNPYLKVAEEEKFVCLMPQGRFLSDGNSYWSYDNNADLIFLSGLIDSAILRYNIDTERIYLTGHSNGGFMTFFLAKEFESRLAAIGPIAGTLGYSVYASYRLNKPMPLCYIHGTADMTVPVTGNPTHVSFEKILEFWVPNNKVNPVPVITELPDINKYDNSTVTKFEYKNLSGRSGDIVYFRINNGNHSIPGTVSWSNQDISAWVEMWKFFKTRRLSDK